MNDVELIEQVRDLLHSEDIYLSELQLEIIHSSVISVINEIVDRGDILDIVDFGTFEKRTINSRPQTIFTMDESLKERLNS